jgi:hypothetical protein
MIKCSSYLACKLGPGEGRFATVADAGSRFQKALPVGCLQKAHAEKTAEAADAPVMNYSPTTPKNSFATL